MTWVLTEKEIMGVLAADPRRRYEYFVHRACDTKRVWTLHADDWARFTDGGQLLIPLWPHERFAAMFCIGEWAGYIPKAIELHEFLEKWPQTMKRDGLEPAILPGASGRAVIVSIDELVAHLRHELAEYYGEDV